MNRAVIQLVCISTAMTCGCSDSGTTQLSNAIADAEKSHLQLAASRQATAEALQQVAETKLRNVTLQVELSSAQKDLAIALGQLAELQQKTDESSAELSRVKLSAEKTWQELSAIRAADLRRSLECKIRGAITNYDYKEDATAKEVVKIPVKKLPVYLSPMTDSKARLGIADERTVRDLLLSDSVRTETDDDGIFEVTVPRGEYILFTDAFSSSEGSENTIWKKISVTGETETLALLPFMDFKSFMK